MNIETKKRITDINNDIIPEGYKKTKVGIVPVEWEISSLDKYIVEHNEKSTENNQYPVLTSSRRGLMFQTDYFKDRQVTTENNAGYNIIPYGYLTFRSRTDDGRFVFNRNNIIDKGIISYFYPVFTFNNAVDTTFMLELLNFTIYHKFMPYKEGTAQQVLSLKKLGKLTYILPPLPEQQKIAEILSTQDKLIELQERKINQLKTLKKGYLQKMFPKKGCKYPELRFKGFTDAWEQREFGKLYRKSSEKNDGSIGIDRNITVASMQFKNDIQVSSDEYLKTYYTFNLGDIAFEGHHSKEFKFGRFVENNIGNGIVSHIFAVFRPIDKYDLCYWKYAINNEYIMQKILSRSTKASTMMHDLVTEDFLKEKIAVPSLEEQRQIGSFLNGLDNLITLNQRKLDEEKQKKKALMQLLLTGKVRVI